jgi:hypothetical protein
MHRVCDQDDSRSVDSITAELPAANVYSTMLVKWCVLSVLLLATECSTVGHLAQR